MKKIFSAFVIKIRKTQPTDITILMDIFEQAKHIMRKDGNMLQWRGNYPSREIVIAFYFICVVSFFDSGCKGNAFCDSLFS